MKKSQPIISKKTLYSFYDYFKLVDYQDEIFDYFGYSYNRQSGKLPRYTGQLKRLTDLEWRLEKNFSAVNLTNEAAKREFLIAPVLMYLVEYTNTKIRVEFPLNVNAQLQGIIDYYLQAKHHLLIIEAKQSDLDRGFMQLAVELIALEQWTNSQAPQLYGAVSTGEIWRFVVLTRAAKRITQDLTLFRVPTDLEDLLRVLMAILGE